MKNIVILISGGGSNMAAIVRAAEHERWAERFGAALVTRLLHDPQGHPVDLSDGEFRLLRALVQHPRRVLTRDQLVQYALGAESDSYDRAIDVQVSRLRRKLASGEVRADLIRTVRNEGYMFVPAVTRNPAPEA